jgi:hypothetical protein
MIQEVKQGQSKMAIFTDTLQVNPLQYITERNVISLSANLLVYMSCPICSGTGDMGREVGEPRQPEVSQCRGRSVKPSDRFGH